MDKVAERLRVMMRTLKGANQTMMPTEMELAERFGVGRNTVRRAIAQLEQEGVVERIRGKGTFLKQRFEQIAFSNWVSAEMGADRFLDQLVQAYQREAPEVRINNTGVPYQEYLHSVFHEMLGRRVPDVVQVTPFWLRRLQRFGLFQPLDRFIEQNIVQRRYATAFRLGRVGGEVYALNWALCPLVLYYNKTVMEEVGLDPDRPPRTLEELAEMSSQVSSADKGNRYGVCLPLDLHEISFMVLYPFFLSFFGGFTDSIGNIVIDSEENLRALRWLADFYRDSGMNKETSIHGIRMLFASNHLAFMVDGPYGRGHLRNLSSKGRGFDENYGVAAMPVGPSRRSENVLLSHALALTRRAPNPEAAFGWIKFLATNERFARLYFDEFGMIPCNRDYLHQPFFSDDPFASVLIRQVESASVGPIDHPLFWRILPFLLQAVADVLLRGREPMNALRSVKEFIPMISRAESMLCP